MRAKVRVPTDDVCTDFVYVRVCVYVAGSPVYISPSLSLPLRIYTHIRKFCVCVYIYVYRVRAYVDDDVPPRLQVGQIGRASTLITARM